MEYEMDTHPRSMTNAQRVRRAEAKKTATGWRRLPNAMIPPPVAATLAALTAAGYANSPSAVIARAILEVGEKFLGEIVKKA
jgi:hypothetical protein